LAKKPVTLCVSTQVGCAMACTFCASGRAGLTRGLGAAEIVSQVLLSRGYLDDDEQLRNLVFMGMGEPLHHYDETLRALRLITHPDGIGMSPRRITVSTVGLAPNIGRLGADFDGKIGLAVSLHAPNDSIRSELMPINRRYAIAELLAALRAYPLPKRRRITIEYTLIDGLNDRPEHANELAKLLRGLRVKVNLIPMNPVDGADMCAPSQQAVEAFRGVLASQRVSCSVRKRRGDDVDAACGQLALKNQAGSVPISEAQVLRRST
jgi:23S rRNA (adenine2503-C2)-methyltransferase